MSYTVTSSNPSAVGTSLSGSQLTLSYSGDCTGTATIDVTAADAAGNTSTEGIPVSFTSAATVSSPAFLAADVADEVTVDLERGTTTFSVSELMGRVFTDHDSYRGVAITGVDPSEGTIEYSTDGGLNWNSFSGTLATTNALLLDQSNLLEFIPNNASIGPIDNAITFEAWDEISGSGSSGSYVSTTSDSAAFSGTTANATLQITPMIGPTMPVDTDSTLNDASQVVDAVNSSGTSIVIWTTSSNNLMAQFYATDTGSPICSTFPINPVDETVTAGAPVMVSASSDGSFVVGWRQASTIAVSDVSLTGSGPSVSTPVPVTLSSTLSPGFAISAPTMVSILPMRLS